MLLPTQVAEQLAQILQDRTPDWSDSIGNLSVWYEKRHRKSLLSAAKCTSRDELLSKLDPVHFQTMYENEIFIKLKRPLTDNLQLIPCGFVIPRQDVEDINPRDPYLEVVVHEVTSPSQFWITLLKRFQELNALMLDLNEHYNEHGERTLYQVETVFPGEYFTARYNGEWHRVKSKGFNPEDRKVKAFYIDYGTLEDVPILELRHLDMKFSALPAQAFPACLYNLVPAENQKVWARDTCVKFLEVSILLT